MPINPRARRLVFAAAALVILLGVIALETSSPPAEPLPRAPVATAPSAPIIPPQAQAPAAPTDPVLDLFQPSDASLQQQLSTSTIAQHIETAMVTSYTLVRCNLIDRTEYAATFNALILYATRTHLAPDAAQAEARVRAIADDAAASYSLVYSNANCADPSLVEKAAALKQWREQIAR